jgi:hypothetical protein
MRFEYDPNSNLEAIAEQTGNPKRRDVLGMALGAVGVAVVGGSVYDAAVNVFPTARRLFGETEAEMAKQGTPRPSFEEKRNAENVIDPENITPQSPTDAQILNATNTLRRESDAQGRFRKKYIAETVIDYDTRKNGQKAGVLGGGALILVKLFRDRLRDPIFR